jgi:hypothetical protein
MKNETAVLGLMSIIKKHRSLKKNGVFLCKIQFLIFPSQSPAGEFPRVARNDKRGPHLPLREKVRGNWIILPYILSLRGYKKHHPLKDGVFYIA